MKNDIIIEVKNVSKDYPQKPQFMRMRSESFLTFFLQRLFRKNGSAGLFHAIRNVSFSVRRGESVGIVGNNGAGKSTLLRVITGITAPTNGEVKIHGKFGELFALNSGFNNDLSGRKNIYLLAAIKGVSREVIEQRVDQIIEFAEIGEFIDQPVKVYSSGMRGRLGFSILIHLLPEIIIIDEALATGDKNFQEKCQTYLEGLVARDNTMLIVSHSMSRIEVMCKRVIWLEAGKIRMDGPAEEVLEAYQAQKAPQMRF